MIKVPERPATHRAWESTGDPGGWKGRLMHAENQEILHPNKDCQS